MLIRANKIYSIEQNVLTAYLQPPDNPMIIIFLSIFRGLINDCILNDIEKFVVDQEILKLLEDTIAFAFENIVYHVKKVSFENLNVISITSSVLKRTTLTCTQSLTVTKKGLVVITKIDIHAFANNATPKISSICIFG